MKENTDTQFYLNRMRHGYDVKCTDLYYFFYIYIIFLLDNV